MNAAETQAVAEAIAALDQARTLLAGLPAVSTSPATVPAPPPPLTVESDPKAFWRAFVKTSADIIPAVPKVRAFLGAALTDAALLRPWVGNYKVKPGETVVENLDIVGGIDVSAATGDLVIRNVRFMLAMSSSAYFFVFGSAYAAHLKSLLIEHCEGTAEAGNSKIANLCDAGVPTTIRRNYFHDLPTDVFGFSGPRFVAEYNVVERYGLHPAAHGDFAQGRGGSGHAIRYNYIVAPCKESAIGGGTMVNLLRLGAKTGKTSNISDIECRGNFYGGGGYYLADFVPMTGYTISNVTMIDNLAGGDTLRPKGWDKSLIYTGALDRPGVSAVTFAGNEDLNGTPWQYAPSAVTSARSV